MIQIPQLVDAANTPEIEAFFRTIRPFLEDVARECAESPSFFPSAQTTFTVPDDWAPLVLINSWQPFGAPQFGTSGVRMSVDGECQARGAVSRTTSPATGAVIAAVPAGYAVAEDGDRRVLVETLGGVGAVEVIPPRVGYPNGLITYLSGSSAFMDLSALRWRTSARATPAWKAPPTFRFSRRGDDSGEVTPELLIMQADTLDTNGRQVAESVVCLPRWRLSTGGVQVTSCTELRPRQTYRLTAWAITR